MSIKINALESYNGPDCDVCGDEGCPACLPLARMAERALLDAISHANAAARAADDALRAIQRGRLDDARDWTDAADTSALLARCATTRASGCLHVLD